jgi:ornithine cyclodeaminase
MQIAFYDSSNVRRLLDYPGCIEAVREAMAGFTAEGKPAPLREIVTIAPGDFFASMPGMLAPPNGFGAKVVSAFHDPDAPGGRSKHQGLVLLFDHVSGAPLAIADAEDVTAIRTAAASAVATDALARKDARRLAIFGCGHEAETHIRAIACVRDLEEVLVWGRSPERAAAFVSRMAAETGLNIRFVADGREAARGADIICTVTGSATPILFGDWVAPGAHVNAVGSSFAGPVEVDSALVKASRYVADSRRSVLAAGSEFLVAKEAGLIGDDHIVAEIGEVLLGRVAGRTSAQEITFYKSLGHVVQDLAATRYVHLKATRAG